MEKVRDKTETHEGYAEGDEYCLDCGASGGTLVLYSCRRCKLHVQAMASLPANFSSLPPGEKEKYRRRLPEGHELKVVEVVK